MSISYTVGVPAHLSAAMVARKKRNKRQMLAGLMLTPMVDMFSLLVIFLLQFFAASPDFQLTSGVVLPESVSSDILKEVPVVSASQGEVFVDRERVGDLKAILKDPEPLALRLEALRTKWAAEHPDEPFAGEINLEAHYELESTTVSHLMAILSAQHFGTIQLIALGE